MTENSLEDKLADVNVEAIRKYKQTHFGKYPLLEKLIKRGLSLCELAEVYGVSRQAVHSIIKSRYLHEFFKEKRAFYLRQRHKKAYVNRLAELVLQIAFAKANPPERLALSHYYSCRSNRKELDAYIRLFEVAFQFKRQGAKLNLKEVALYSGFDYTTAGILLNKYNLSDVINSRRRLDDEKLSLVKAALEAETKLSYADRAYIIGVPCYAIYNYKKNRKARISSPYPLIRHTPDVVTYRKALEFYELIDSDFNIADAMDYSGIKRKETVDELLAMRNRVESEVEKFKRQIGLA